MSQDTFAHVIECAERLIEAVEAAPLETAFDKNGNGPMLALVDQIGFAYDRQGPIRKRATALKQALLDHESAMRARCG